jgi:type II secretory pathway component GspD/PulD (secretin)
MQTKERKNARRTPNFKFQTQKIVLLLISLVGFVFLVIAIPGLSEERSIAVIRMSYRTAEETVSVVKALLSSEGNVAADPGTNSLIISDNEESISKIRDFLKGYDVPVEQVKVRVKFNESEASSDRFFSGRGRISGEHGSLSTGGRRRDDGIDVRLQDRTERDQSASEYFITVSSGSSAYIMAGKHIPYQERWVYLCHRYASVTDTVEFKEIETGFDIRPTIMGERAYIEIIPRIAHEAPGEGAGVIRFAQASTSLTVPVNQWVTLGGGEESSNEVIREILSCGRGGENSSLSISLRVEK